MRIHCLLRSSQENGVLAKSIINIWFSDHLVSFLFKRLPANFLKRK
jgi:hypothetical protein